MNVEKLKITVNDIPSLMNTFLWYTLVEIRSFDCNTFRQTFSRFGHVIRSYFGYAYKIRHQIECRLLYCIKFYIISVSIPFGKLSANIQPFRSCESVKVQLGLKFGKEIKTNWPTYFIAYYTACNSAFISVSEPFGHVNRQNFC